MMYLTYLIIGALATAFLLGKTTDHFQERSDLMLVAFIFYSVLFSIPVLIFLGVFRLLGALLIGRKKK